MQFISLVHTQAMFGLKAEASKFYLSYLWWILEPLLFVMVFYLVFNTLLGTRSENFLLFLMCGKVPFLWFSKSVTSAASSIVQNRGLLGQLHIDKAVFPYVAVHQSLYKVWCAFLALFIMVIVYGFMPAVGWLWLLPLLITQYLMILVFSLICSILVAFIPDVRLLIAMGMTFLLFSSGIFWDISDIMNRDAREWLPIINPLLFLIDGYRKILLENEIYNINHLATIGSVFLVLLFFLHRLCARLSQRIAQSVLAG